jgi:hypothetical protein
LQLAATECRAVLEEALGLAVTGRVAKAIVMIVEQPADQAIAFTISLTPEQLAAQVAVGPGLAADIQEVCARIRQQHVQRAVHGIRAIQGRGGPADHFDRAGQFRQHLESFVDVAEASGPDGEAVLEEQEAAAGTRPRECRRADRRDAFLAIATGDPGARDLRAGLVYMCGVQQFNPLCIEAGGVAGQFECRDRITGGGDEDFFRRAATRGLCSNG